MFSRLLKKYSLLIVVLILFFLPNNSYANDKFLTLPFTKEQNLMQGWFYNFGNKTHQGIDYYAPVGTKLVAMADGRLYSYFQPGKNFVYGRYIVLSHDNGYKTLYAHLNKNETPEAYKRGDTIAESGMSGTDNPHLHLEVLSPYNNGQGLNRGFGWRMDPYDIYKTSYYYPGSAGYTSLGANHLWKDNYPNIYKPPVVASELSGEIKSGLAHLSWTESQSGEFAKYEIYRSEVEGGTKDANKRELLDTVTDKELVNYTDSSNLLAKKDYYYAVATFEKDGRSAISNEIRLIRNHEIINITNQPYSQTEPRVQGRYVVWKDYRYEQTSFPTNKTLYYYDLETREAKTTQIGNLLNRLEGPYGPDVYGDLVCYHAKDSSSSDREIYCHNLKTGYDLPITNNKDHDYYPRISSAGYVVWTKVVGTLSKLYALNLNDAVGEYLVVDAPYNQAQPSIDGSIVVWKDTRTGNRSDIYMKDLAGGEEILLATNTGGGAVEISGDYITWANKGAAYILNIKTKEQTMIENSDVRVAEIDGGKVAYFKYEGGSLGNIYIYEIEIGTHTKIDNPLYWVPRMDIYGDVLVFSAPGPNETHYSHMDIYLTYL
jgi:beta propeller repeat protein